MTEPISKAEAVAQVRDTLRSDANLLILDGPANLLGPDVLDVIAEQVLNLFVAGVGAGVQGRTEQWSGEALDWLRRRLRAVMRRDGADSIRPAEPQHEAEANLLDISNLDAAAVLRFADISETITAAVLVAQGMTAARAATVAKRARQATLAAVGAQ